MTHRTPEGWASDPNARGLRLELSPDRTLLLPFDQFLHAELVQKGDTQELSLSFATHEVAIRGHSLKRLVAALQTQELALVTLLPKPLQDAVPDGQPRILAITVRESAAQADAGVC